MTDRKREPDSGSRAPANDNDGGMPKPVDPAMKKRVEELVHLLARALGRQIAREEFARRLDRLAGANDNLPLPGPAPGRDGREHSNESE